MSGARAYLLERVNEAAVVQLYADGFQSLSLRDRILAWHLYLAALAGRDIYYDQRHVHNLAMGDVLEGILRHSEAVEPRVLAEIRRYTKLFWLNTGPYNNLTARKFLLLLTRHELVAAAQAAATSGARFPQQPGKTLEGLIDRLAPMFFDPACDQIVTRKSPGAGRDILECSAKNLYDGVTTADLGDFDERYGLNSRLVKRDGGVIEEVYRVGGRYDREIRRVICHLEDAIPCATPTMAKALRALIRFYHSGEEADRVAYDIAWVRDRDSPVDTINGFVEVYMNLRGPNARVLRVQPERPPFHRDDHEGHEDRTRYFVFFVIVAAKSVVVLFVASSPCVLESAPTPRRDQRADARRRGVARAGRAFCRSHRVESDSSRHSVPGRPADATC